MTNPVVNFMVIWHWNVQSQLERSILFVTRFSAEIRRTERAQAWFKCVTVQANRPGEHDDIIPSLE
jgi:hypothetical protein